ncbi:aminoglycoside phosphotransferase family protein [Lentzea sp. HUAS TT2]|uniref:aminoglycoside phosphotransferase family protein n=1 Tax=Lentzea sp. HUAS TT2 TaxID=3447454 RepID=UPI003F7278AA
MHDDGIDVREDVVRAMIADQFPAWASEPVQRIASDGTVNTIFRIGDEAAARFLIRRRTVDAAREVLKREAEASQRFADQSTVPAPRPIAIGEPAEGYPLPWAVQTWIPGTIAPIEFEGSADFSHDLAGLITALRATDTRGKVFEGHNRGGDIRDHDEWVEECFKNSEDLLDVPHLRRLWAHFRDLPRTSADVMSHGDLQPLNVLVSDGRLAGVLDTGGFAPADPALDTMSAWYLLGDDSRAIFRELLNCDDLEWERSKAWSFQQCLGAIWYYVDSNPVMYRMGRLALDRIVANTRI